MPQVTMGVIQCPEIESGRKQGLAVACGTPEQRGRLPGMTTRRVFPEVLPFAAHQASP